MRTQKAKDFAIIKHRGQKYGTGDYFQIHVQGVADSVNKSLSERDGVHHSRISLLLIVAYLHDTVEDSDATLEEIESIFGVVIADAVDAMTLRDGEDYQEYVKRATENSIARYVKYHDILFNLNQTILDSAESTLGKRRCGKYMKALKLFSKELW